MGCDIHLYREKRIEGRWVTADTWEGNNYGDGEIKEVPYKTTYHGRNYDLFGMLANGVRREFPFSFEPRGMPLNACHEVLAAHEYWDADGHNHSYLYLHELRDLREWLNSNTIEISGMKNADQLAELRSTIEAGSPNWDLLYPYCKWGSSPDLVEFSIDVPASFAVGQCLDQIIALFDGVDGENHRIVFWFDN